MKRNLKIIVGFCEVVVPSYAIDEFRSHFRMTKTTFKVLAEELAATGAIPTGNRFGRKTNSITEADFGSLLTGKQNSQQQLCWRIPREAGKNWRMTWNWFRMANGTHIFRSDIPFGNFGLTFKTFRLFWKISVRANQNRLTIYIPTEISGIFR